MKEFTPEFRVHEWAEDPDLSPTISYVAYFYDLNVLPKDFTFGELAKTNFPGDTSVKHILSSLKIVHDRLKKDHFYHSIDDKRTVGYFDYSIENPIGTLFIAPGGGYWNVCAYTEGFELAELANQKGFSAFVVGYGVRQYGEMPGPLNDLGNVIKDVYAKLGNRVTKDYCLCGASASGHLTAMFCEKEHGYLAQGIRKPKKLIVMYPVIDFGPEAHVGSRYNALKDKANDPKSMEEYSVHLHVDKDFPETWISRGVEDECVPVVNSDLFDEALTKAGVKHIYRVEQEGHWHGYGPLWHDDDSTWFNDVLDWMAK